MGIFGCGNAFNLRYRPSGPLRTYIYERPMPPRPSIFCGMGTAQYTQNITYETGPTGFWGFLSGFLNSFMMMGGLNCFAGLGGGGGVKPQGADGDEGAAQKGYADQLANLNTLFKDYKGGFVDNKNGTFSVNIPGEGVFTGTYEEMKDKLGKPAEPKKNPVVTTNDDPPAATAPRVNTSPVTTHQPNEKISAADLSAFSGTGDIIDELGDETGKATSIRNKQVTIGTETDADSGYPITLKFGDYTYKLAETQDNGAAIYTSQQGNHQSYRLEWGADGRIQLIQHKEGETETLVSAGNGEPDISSRPRTVRRNPQVRGQYYGGSSKGNRFVNDQS